MVVAAYGLILPGPVLEAPALGCVNVHASLLPRWRGAAPIARAIEAGDTVTGISLMQMDQGLDTGPVFAQVQTPISARDTAASLHDRLAILGGRLLVDSLPAVLDSSLPAESQDPQQVTYANKLQRAEAPIIWTNPAQVIVNKIRAFNPWPVAEAVLNSHKLRIWQAVAAPKDSAAPPGTVLTADPDGVVVACGDGAVCLTELQRTGGKVLTVKDFLNGFPIQPGDCFR